VSLQVAAAFGLLAIAGVIAQSNTPPVSHEYADVNGVRLHYAKAGRGPLMVFLHGFPEFWYEWKHQIAEFSRDHTVAAPDMRGYNLSDKPPRVADYELDKLVDDVTGLIRHFGREQAAIVGHDWGAIVAWSVAEKHPEAVWKLCAMQVPPMKIWKKNQTFKQFLAIWYMFFFQIPGLPEWLLSRNDFALPANGLKTSTAQKGVFIDADIAEYKKSWREDRALSSALNYYRANILQRLFGGERADENIKVPTLFIYGEKDAVILPETVKGIGNAIDAPFSEIRIPDAGHWVQQEAAEIVNDSLREFLAE
jgi:pimeloyl-ACP methyl ester carboxylesterase